MYHNYITKYTYIQICVCMTKGSYSYLWPLFHLPLPQLSPNAALSLSVVPYQPSALTR